MLLKPIIDNFLAKGYARGQYGTSFIDCSDPRLCLISMGGSHTAYAVTGLAPADLTDLSIKLPLQVPDEYQLGSFVQRCVVPTQFTLKGNYTKGLALFCQVGLAQGLAGGQAYPFTIEEAEEVFKQPGQLARYRVEEMFASFGVIVVLVIMGLWVAGWVLLLLVKGLQPAPAEDEEDEQVVELKTLHPAASVWLSPYPAANEKLVLAVTELASIAFFQLAYFQGIDPASEGRSVSFFLLSLPVLPTCWGLWYLLGVLRHCLLPNEYLRWGCEGVVLAAMLTLMWVLTLP